MLTATLGGLIKDYRIKKRLSQLKLALEIGWKDTTRLSKIEQGKVKPTRETLDKIMNALGLSEQEKGQILFSSGIIPSKSEAKQAINRLKAVTASFQYPLILVDFAWNVHYFNLAAKEVFKLTQEEYEAVEKSNLHWFELFFLRKSFNEVKIRGGLRENRLLNFAEHEIALFKYEQVGNTNESWYGEVLVELNKKSKEFHKLWLSVSPYKEEHLLYEYEVNTFEGKWGGKEETLRFYVYSIHPTFDFRFYLLIHQPIDETTLKFYQDRNP